MAQALDVATTTPKNRIALQGRLDFVNDRFDDVTVALIDAKGCATVEQKIRGSFSNPVVEQPSPLTSLAGPALNLLKQGGALLRDGHRDVFLRRIGRGAPVNRLDPPGHVKAACSRSP